MSDAAVMRSHPTGEPGKAVLVTGASSGIGLTVTRHLAANGYLVYAGARKSADMRALGALRNVRALALDIRDPCAISAAVTLVQSEGARLCGLVNNAGIATLGPVLGGDIQELTLLINVNVLGTYRVTQAFAPLIVAERGRIVTIGSTSGILAARNVGAYSMTKHALEAFTDSLAAELEQAGVHVSVVEPGRFNTSLVHNVRERTGGNALLPDLARSPEPDAVARAVMHALFEPAPKRRYLVVSTQEEALATIDKQIEQLVQLNERHAYSLERATLIQMLDRHLASSLLLPSSSGSTSQPDPSCGGSMGLDAPTALE